MKNKAKQKSLSCIFPSLFLGISVKIVLSLLSWISKFKMKETITSNISFYHINVTGNTLMAITLLIVQYPLL